MSQRAVTRSGYHFIVRFISESPMFREIGLIWRIPVQVSSHVIPLFVMVSGPGNSLKRPPQLS